MNLETIGITTAHCILSIVLFFGVNWIGKHAVEFGYTSVTLFEEPNESIALNFFLRAMSPTVFIIALSALVVAIGRPQWRIDIYLVAPYYYLLRFCAIFLLDRQGLVSWPKFAIHAAIGIAAALVAYHYLVIPNRSLLPDLKSAGNEIWLAILAFLYAVANKVPAQGGPGARRRNKFVARHYARALARYGSIIDARIKDERLKLIAYAVLIFEDYARPRAVREVERMMFWRRSRTTGIMQVSAETALSDEESVIRGTTLLAAAWEEFAGAEELWARFRATVVAYNTDADYVSRVSEVMEILAMRAAPGFRAAYDEIYK